MGPPPGQKKKKKKMAALCLYNPVQALDVVCENSKIFIQTFEFSQTVCIGPWHIDKVSVHVRGIDCFCIFFSDFSIVIIPCETSGGIAAKLALNELSRIMKRHIK